MQTSPLEIRSLNDLRGQVWEWRGSAERIGFVPTMGALHDGHLSLVNLAQKKADKVVVSIFVNPKQFAPNEDLDAYPRPLATDIEKLKSVGCDAVYIPSAPDLYPDYFATAIAVAGPALGLETDFRPHFFDGVALIVAKLFNRVAPDIAVFGEKDYQQLLTIKRMTKDFDFPIKIVSAPIVREADGLAMSSRNRYFDAEGRAIAGQLNVVMRACRDAICQGADIQSACAQARDALLAKGFDSVDYVALADPNSLSLLTGKLDGRAGRLLLAAHCKSVRLIDNCAV